MRKTGEMTTEVIEFVKPVRIRLPCCTDPVKRCAANWRREPKNNSSKIGKPGAAEPQPPSVWAFSARPALDPDSLGRSGFGVFERSRLRPAPLQTARGFGADA